jgi:hypothetical protein
MTKHIPQLHTGGYRPKSRRRIAALVTAAAASLAVAASPAAASAAIPSFASSTLSSSSSAGTAISVASPYGQASRFGGYSSSAASGKFVYPVGFAVDSHDSSTSDKNAVYVLDRTVDDLETGELGYRLQKLSSSGTVLGSVALPVQKYSDTEDFTDAHPLISLAVDSSEHRVYALVESIVASGFGEYVPVTSELVAWSTVPNANKELAAAPGYAKDPLTQAGLVASSSVLQSGTTSGDLYAPEGLSVDPSNHDVLIEAQQGVKNGTEGGPTILQRVATEGSKSGQLDGDWVANSTIAPNGEAPDGVFTADDGSFGVKLFQGQNFAVSRLADVKPGFATPEASLLASDTSGGLDRDEAPAIDNEYTVNHRFGADHGLSGASAFSPYIAGSPVTQLSNGLYAARYGQPFKEIDPQSEVAPWNGVPYFWLQKNNPVTETANMGVRLFTSSGAVVTTIGGQAAGQACNLDFAQLAVAAGANGSLFVLTQPNEENSNSDDEVIEFTPGGKGSCPQPSGAYTVNGKTGKSFTFPVGEKVTLADTVEREGEAPYRFDWVLLNTSTLGIEDLHNQIEGPEYKWPAPSTSHTVSKEGTYDLAASLYGDYGVVQVGEVVSIKIVK